MTTEDVFAEVYETLAEHFPDAPARRVRDCSLAVARRLELPDPPLGPAATTVIRRRPGGKAGEGHAR